MRNQTLKYDSMPGADDLIFSKDLSGDIEMGAWTAGDANLLSVGASTCIILAAHNIETRRGLLGHFSEIASEESGYSDKASFEQAIAAIRSLGSSDATSVWLRGGAPNLHNGIDDVSTDRLYAQEKIRECTEKSEIEWSQPNRVIDVELDCPTGILVVHNYPEKAVILGSRAVRRALHPL